MIRSGAVDSLLSLPAGTKIVAGTFTISGIVHFVRPVVFEPLIPPALGDARAWVYASGGAELACALGLAARQPWAPPASAGTLAVIWVGNVHMARQMQKSRRPAWAKAMAWARLPVQLPLVVWALRSPVGSDSRSAEAAVPVRISAPD